MLEDVGGTDNHRPQLCCWGVMSVAWRVLKEKKDGFGVGDKVTWTSQASGRTKTKIGKIVRVLSSSSIKSGRNPCNIADKEFKNHTRMFDGYQIPGGYDTGYLVEVITGPNSKPKLYMPYPSKLTLSKKD